MLAAGSAVLFVCMTPHASLPNVSCSPRRSLFLSYNPGEGRRRGVGPEVGPTPALYSSSFFGVVWTFLATFKKTAFGVIRSPRAHELYLHRNA